MELPTEYIIVYDKKYFIAMIFYLNQDLKKRRNFQTCVEIYGKIFIMGCYDGKVLS
jgi:hypothetical protein